MFIRLFSIISLIEGDRQSMTIPKGRQFTVKGRQGCVAGVLALFCFFTLPAWASDPIVVGSKNFMESRLLSEMFAQLIEARTELPVTRRFGLAGTQVCFEALKTGGIDLYPETTGKGV
jgi:glycine betaine/choline ABC-type transport system substrate-binding protein